MEEVDIGMKLLSLFSGCGGMDIGFEGNFRCLKKSVNTNIHPEWIIKDEGEWVTLAPTIMRQKLRSLHGI